MRTIKIDFDHKWTTQYLTWVDCGCKEQMEQVQGHVKLYERTLYVPLAPSISSWFWLEMNSTISHKSWLRMQRTDGTGSGTLALYTSTMYVPLTPSIASWLLRKVHFATVYGRHTNRINLVHKLTTKYLIWIGCGCTELMEQEQGNQHCIKELFGWCA